MDARNSSAAKESLLQVKDIKKSPKASNSMVNLLEETDNKLENTSAG